MINKFDSSIFKVHFNAHTLNPGNYSHTLKISSNDSSNLIRLIYINLRIYESQFQEDLLNPDTSLCYNNFFTLFAKKGYQSYTWQDNSKSDHILVKKSGLYKVEVLDKKGCKYFDSTYIDYYPMPIADFYVKVVSECYQTNQFILTNRTWISNDSITKLIWYVEGQTITDMDSIIYSFAKSGVHKVKIVALSNSNCSDTTFKHIEVFNNPIPFIGPDSSLCPNRYLKLTVDSTFQAYKWSTSDTTHSIQYTNTSQKTQNISLEVTDTNGCKGFDSITIANDPDCVYPGDANADGTVDNKDVLYIGIKYNKTGTKRPGASILWRAEYSALWNDTIVGGVDIKHVDTDGDGVIDNNDTTAISTNYGKTRKLEDHGRSSDPPFYIDLPDTLVAGQLVKAPIILGSSAKPVQDFYGLSFDIVDPSGVIKDQKVSFDFNSSWIGDVQSNLLTFMKGYDLCLVRTDQANQDGYGSIGELIFTVDENIKSNKNYSLTLANNFAISKDQKEKPLYTKTDSVIVINGIPDTKQDHAFDIKLYPNPTESSGNIELRNCDAGEMVVELYDLQGAKVLSGHYETRNGNLNTSIDLTNFARGMYFLKVSNDKYQLNRKVIKR